MVATGWLYLLRGGGVFDFGPHVKDALPLQQLAGDGAQPLARLLLVWLPAGALGAAALSASGLSAWVRVAAVTVVAAAVLLVAGAVSDAAAISESVTSHLSAQPTRPGTLVAVVMVAVGASVVAWRSPGPVGTEGQGERGLEGSETG